MKIPISVVIAARNDEAIIARTLESVMEFDEIIVVLANDSADGTLEVVKKYSVKIYRTKNHLARQRMTGVKSAKHPWVLILDTDEVLTRALADEMRRAVSSRPKASAFQIPYANYFLGHPVKHGNQSYKKIRLIHKDRVSMDDFKTHPEIHPKAEVETLSNSLQHYSFRALSQVIQKFDYYAREDAPQIRREYPQISIIHITLYPLHMWWTLFFDDKGYRDGIWGFLLALCFGYYELKRYIYASRLTSNEAI